MRFFSQIGQFNTQITNFYRSFSECLDKITADFEGLIDDFSQLKNSKYLFKKRTIHFKQYFA